MYLTQNLGKNNVYLVGFKDKTTIIAIAIVIIIVIVNLISQLICG